MAWTKNRQKIRIKSFKNRRAPISRKHRAMLWEAPAHQKIRKRKLKRSLKSLFTSQVQLKFNKNKCQNKNKAPILFRLCKKSSTSRLTPSKQHKSKWNWNHLSITARTLSLRTTEITLRLQRKRKTQWTLIYFKRKTFIKVSKKSVKRKTTRFPKLLCLQSIVTTNEAATQTVIWGIKDASLPLSRLSPTASAKNKSRAFTRA